jgi:hypothetical protein
VLSVSRFSSTSTITLHRARTPLDATFDHPRLRISTLFSKCLAERENLLVERQAPRTLRGRPKSPTARRPVCRSVYCFIYPSILRSLLRPIAILRVCDGFELGKLYLLSPLLSPFLDLSMPRIRGHLSWVPCFISSSIAAYYLDSSNAFRLAWLVLQVCQATSVSN